MTQHETQLEPGTTRVKAKIKRGDGPDDRDEITVESTFESLDEAVSQRAQFKQYAAAIVSDVRGIDGEAEVVVEDSVVEASEGELGDYETDFELEVE